MTVSTCDRQLFFVCCNRIETFRYPPLSKLLQECNEHEANCEAHGTGTPSEDAT